MLLSPFTELLVDGLRGQASDYSGNVTALSLYSLAASILSTQMPQLKANCLKMPVLRRVRPPVPLEILRRLPDCFPKADSRIRLSPAYENDGLPFSPDADKSPEQETYRLLTEIRNAGLLRYPDSLFYSAMRSEPVWLSPAGQHLWRLAKRGAI